MTDATMAERRTRLRDEIRNADDPERLWPASDLLDAMELVPVTKRRLLWHLQESGDGQVSLRALMDMCVDGPVVGLDFMMPPLLRVQGIGKKGFASVINGLTAIDLGNRCNREWQLRLTEVRRKYGVASVSLREARNLGVPGNRDDVEGGCSGRVAPAAERSYTG